MITDILPKECDCAIVTSPAALYYLSGFDQSDAIILVTKEGAEYLTNPLFEVAVKGAVSSDLTVKVMSRRELTEHLNQAVSAARKVGVEYDHMTLSRFRSVFGSFAAETLDISPILASLRAVKRRDEIEIIKRAEEIVDLTYRDVLPLIKVGVTEIEIKNAILKGLLRYGAEGTAFDTIVAFGQNAAMPHAVPSGRKLAKGDCILMDFGAKYKGYCSDFTRTIFCGEPSDKFLTAYRLVFDAQRAAIAYLESGGRSASELDAVARKVIDSSDFRGLFNHTLGHGVGIEIHETPVIATSSSDTLSEGSVFTIEPGIYVEGEFGIRIESLAVIENGKLTVIDRSDKEIYIV